MNRVVHFEFASKEPQREIEFFSSVFGWKIEAWGDQEYWLATTGAEGDPGINGAIMPLAMPDQPRTVNTIGVDDIDSTVERAKAAGAMVAMEKQEIPGYGWTVYLTTPTGILFGLFETMPGGAM